MTQRMRSVAARAYAAAFVVVWLLAFMLPACVLMTGRWFRDRDRERIDSPAFAVQLEDERRAR